MNVRAPVHILRTPVRSWHVLRWAVVSGRQLKADLRDRGLDAISALPRPPRGAAADRSTVSAALWCARFSCLVRAAVLQRWDAERGVSRALHIGVRRSVAGVEAHAWLDGDPVEPDFAELHLHPAPVPA